LFTYLCQILFPMFVPEAIQTVGFRFFIKLPLLLLSREKLIFFEIIYFIKSLFFKPISESSALPDRTNNPTSPKSA
jgi:hypothetical protein